MINLNECIEAYVPKDLFPVKIDLLQWKMPEGFNEELSELSRKSYYEELHFNSLKHVEGKIRHNDYNLFDREGDKEVVQQFQEMVKLAVMQYISKDPHADFIFEKNDIYARACPRVYTEDNDWVLPHTHSGVQYVVTYYPKSEIVKDKPTPGGSFVALDSKGYINRGFALPAMYTESFTPYTGTMAVFPSHLFHYTQPWSKINGEKIVMMVNIALIPKELTFTKIM